MEVEKTVDKNLTTGPWIRLYTIAPIELPGQTTDKKAPRALTEWIRGLVLATMPGEKRNLAPLNPKYVGYLFIS